ncbi:MAG: MFS transporter [Planctomycetes bacterium]|nr:MFS transporter [Planctomycetota bacterium]
MGDEGRAQLERLMKPLLRFLRRVVDVREGEVRALLWAAGYFFFLLGSWYVLRPIREEMGVAQDIDKIAYLYLGSLGVTFAATPIFGMLVRKFTRERFIPIVYHVLTINILLLAAALWGAPADWRIGLYRVIYIWTSTFNLFAVSVFWGYMADVMDDARGKRLFGFIAAGGTLGGIAGSFITKEVVQQFGIPALMIFAAVALEAGVFCFYRFSSAARGFIADREARPPSAPVAAGAVAGIGKVARSPYLLVLCVYMLIFTAGSTFVYFEQSEIVAKTASRPEERTRLFATIDLYVNIASFALQSLATGFLIRKFGMSATMALLPALTCCGFLGVGLAPSLGMIFWFQVARRGSDYAIAKPCRDLLFTVLSREEKYSSKSFIDTFVYRGGDAIAAWGRNWMKGSVAHPAAFIAYFATGLSVIWLFIALWLGREQERRARALAVS